IEATLMKTRLAGRESKALHSSNYIITVEVVVTKILRDIEPQVTELVAVTSHVVFPPHRRPGQDCGASDTRPLETVDAPACRRTRSRDSIQHVASRVKKELTHRMRMGATALPDLTGSDPWRASTQTDAFFNASNGSSLARLILQRQTTTAMVVNGSLNKTKTYLEHGRGDMPVSSAASSHPAVGDYGTEKLAARCGGSPAAPCFKRQPMNPAMELEGDYGSSDSISTDGSMSDRLGEGTQVMGAEGAPSQYDMNGHDTKGLERHKYIG
ncbi:hypothetical protein BDZ89DRAFT_1042694, partial [Hymenopellis radicata]